jgi:hypothetical protein
MNKQVQKALEVLVGQPLWSSGRAADLEWFHFGQRRTVNGVRGDTTPVPTTPYPPATTRCCEAARLETSTDRSLCVCLTMAFPFNGCNCERLQKCRELS